jgi:hypothetical protein
VPPISAPFALKLLPPSGFDQFEVPHAPPPLIPA